MRTLMTTLILTLAAITTAHAGGGYVYDGYENIARRAHVLEDAARHFHRQLKHDVGRHHMTRDAKRLAKAARHFHRQVERGGSYRHLRNDYQELARAYGHVRYEFAGRHGLHHDRHFRADFRAVEHAFYELNRAIRYAEHRYSSHRRHERHGWDYDRDDRRYARRSDLEIVLEALFGF